MSYGKVHDVFWEDVKIEALSDRAALLALFLISGPHRNAIGCFRLGLGAITDNPRFGAWGIEPVADALRELSGIGFIFRDDRTGWTLIANGLKHDPIASRNAAIGAAKLAAAVPTGLEVYQRLIARLGPQLDTQLKGQSDVAGYPLRSASEPLAMASEAASNPVPTPEPQPLPQPQPQPEQQPAARADDDFRSKVKTKVAEILNSPTITQFNRIDAWLDAGADPVRDIYPSIEAGLKKLGRPPTTLKYFDGLVADAIAARERPLPPATARPKAGNFADRGAAVAPAVPISPEERRGFLERSAARIGKTGRPLPYIDKGDIAEMLALGLLTIEQCRRAGCAP